MADARDELTEGRLTLVHGETLDVRLEVWSIDVALEDGLDDRVDVILGRGCLLRDRSRD